jgi:opacity protein-like surface antigen
MLLLTCSLAVPAEEATNSVAVSSSAAFKQDFLWSSAQTNRLRIGVYLDYGYVAPGTVDYSGANDHKSDAQSINLALSTEFPLNERWFLPVVVGSENLFLGSVDGVPIPERVHVARVNAGVGYRFAENWTLAAGVGPVLYRFEDVEGDDVGVSGGLRATYRVGPNLILNFGMAFNPDSDVPVLPVLGARWTVQTNLDLNLMFPRTGVIYRVAPRVSLFVGAGLGGATFRTDNAFGTEIGDPRFNHELATYWDVRAGVGVEYQLSRAFAVSLEGGYSVWRELDYKEIDETVRFKPAPCVQVGIKCRL